MLAGIGLKLLSVVAFSVMVTLVKILGDRVPVGQIVFARALFGLLPILALMAYQQAGFRTLETKRPVAHGVRAVLGGTAMTLWFMALARLPLPDATAISFAQPLLTTALAVVILGEIVRLYRWSAVIVGFVGVIIILLPNLGLTGALGDNDRALGAVFALGSALFMALAQVYVRQLIKSETTMATVFYFSAFTALFALTSVPFGWIIPDATTMTLLVLMGLIGGIGQLLMTQSFRLAPASVVAPFDYTAILFALAIGAVLFDEIAGPTVLVGSVLVVGAGLFVIYREHRIGISRDAAMRARTPN